jgi:DNA-binding transcriptional MerR regulator
MREAAAVSAEAPDATPADPAASAARGRLPRKAPNAFRTISEVADDLHIPQHVLRFWETKFVQVRPLKRGGGRRYYRPDDIALLRRISDLLYIQGYTIKGVQRLLREGGGKLSDNIPPPAPEDREEPVAAAAPVAEPELPLPGLTLGPSEAPRRATLPPVPRIPAAPQERSDGGEAARLRGLLREVLAELRAMRALLG